MRYSATPLLTWLIQKLLPWILLFFILPQITIAEPLGYVVNHAQGKYNHPVKPHQTSQNAITDVLLSNCYLYVKSHYPSLPPTKVIQSNIQKEVAEVAVMQYGNLPHYAVVENAGTSTITISETNFGGHKKNIRTISRTDIHLKGYFDLP